MSVKIFRKILSYTLRAFLLGIKNGFYRYYHRFSRFGYLSKNAKIEMPCCTINPKNIFIYDGSRIGPHCLIMASNAKFILCRNSVVAGHCVVVTGNHERKIGRWLLSIKESEKQKDSDNDIIIKEDVWVGMNVTILSGVEIGRGTTVAAGAVVTKSTPPYCIVGGVPARVLKFYWTIDDILEHEKQLYPASERYTRADLEEIIRKNNFSHAGD